MANNRCTFWMIWGFGLAPLVLAAGVYLTGIGLPDEQVNAGRLMVPAIPLESWGGPVDRFTEHWSLLLVHRGRCTPACVEQQEKLKRIHDALGRDADRVRVRVDAVDQLEPGVWIVDPLGNLVLHYESSSWEGKALLTDLRRLLKASRLG